MGWLPIILTFGPLAVMVMIPRRNDPDVEMTDSDRTKYGYDYEGDSCDYEVVRKPRVVKESPLVPRTPRKTPTTRRRK